MLEGVYVANVTPFRDEETYPIDVDAYIAHVEWLADHGVTGVIPFGTNGEGPSVGRDEKREVLEALFAREPSIQVVPAVAEGNLPDTLALLEFVDQLPATAVMVLPPYYFKPVRADGLRRFFERVVAATRHPVVVYHIPKYAVGVPAEVVADLPVWGVKDSGGDPRYGDAVAAAGKGLLIGSEHDLWERLTRGADGSVSALANVVPDQVVDLFAAARAGDGERGRMLADRLLTLRGKTKEHASAGVLKRMAQFRNGAPMGTVRPPLVPPPDDYDVGRALADARVEVLA